MTSIIALLQAAPDARVLLVEDLPVAAALAFPHAVRMNLVVTAVPFGDQDIDAHMDTSTGELVLDEGHLDSPDLTVTVDYDTAKAILIEGNPQAGMQAFMAGKIRVEGDMAKLMALQSAPVGADSPAAQMAIRLREITS